MIIGLILYSVALCAQLLASFYALRIFLRSQSYRLASGFLLLGLVMMVGRRISPLVHAINDDYLNLLDAILALSISLMLWLGMIQFKKLLIDLENKNFALDQISKTDPLTAALSRPETFSRSLLEIERCLRSRKQISFLMLDIDHFKKVNDQYGHLAGDAVLVNLVKICQTQLRVIDILGRVGGEEFFITLPDSSEEEAWQVAERLRTSVANQSTKIDKGAEIFITISIGITVFNPRNVLENKARMILKTFYERADIAMYRSKNNGRDRTTVWNQSLIQPN